MPNGMVSGTQCPQCGSDNVELDPVQALTYCLDCGLVLTDGDFDSSVLFDASAGGPGGIILAENDDGSKAASIGLPKGVKRCGPKGERYGQVKAQARTKALCEQLGLSSAATATAVSATEQLLSKLYKRQRSSGQPLRIANRDRTAAAAVYIAARMEQMPLTAAEVAAAIRISTKTFGRAYQCAVAALGIFVPTVPAQVFLHSCAQRLCRDPLIQACVEQDATALHSWLCAQADHRGTPLLVCAAAVTIALEAHAPQAGGISKARARDVSKLLSVSDNHLARCTASAKTRLVDAAKALPWADKISTRNVALHLPTILKLIGADMAAGA